MKNIYATIMKTRYIIAIVIAFTISTVSCDKGFDTLNIDPLSPSNMDPQYLLASAEQMGASQWWYEACIIQQINLVIAGQEAAGNHNIQKDNLVDDEWDACYGKLKTLTDILVQLEGTTSRTNLYNMARILHAWNFMLLVDYYGDVPFSEAIKGYYTGNLFPKYDKQADIYLAIRKEIISATDALNASNDRVTNDIFFTGDIPKWKKFGNSLLLRLGMRYTKINPDTAASIVRIAIDASRGGVISSNAENVVIPYNSTQNCPPTGFCRSTTMQNWHAAKPFVDFLKNNNDPRMQYWICTYSNPSVSTSTKDTNPASQIGCPIGYDANTISTAPGYPGTVSTGIYKYAQINRSICGRSDCVAYMLTAAQTQLLLADARQRGWITTGTAQQYYENGIKLALTQSDIYSSTRLGASPISTSEQNAYLAQPNIAFNGSNNAIALNQINTQYWIASFLIWDEAWANYRRSGYPVLTRNPYSGADPSVIASSDGFIHRMTYPVSEYNYNKSNVEAATSSIGSDKLGTRVFWDIQ